MHHDNATNNDLDTITSGIDTSGLIRHRLKVCIELLVRYAAAARHTATLQENVPSLLLLILLLLSLPLASLLLLLLLLLTLVV